MFSLVIGVEKGRRRISTYIYEAGACNIRDRGSRRWRDKSHSRYPVHANRH